MAKNISYNLEMENLENNFVYKERVTDFEGAIKASYTILEKQLDRLGSRYAGLGLSGDSLERITTEAKKTYMGKVFENGETLVKMDGKKQEKGLGIIESYVIGKTEKRLEKTLDSSLKGRWMGIGLRAIKEVSDSYEGVKFDKETNDDFMERVKEVDWVSLNNDHNRKRVLCEVLYDMEIPVHKSEIMNGTDTAYQMLKELERFHGGTGLESMIEDATYRGIKIEKTGEKNFRGVDLKIPVYREGIKDNNGLPVSTTDGTALQARSLALMDQAIAMNPSGKEIPTRKELLEKIQKHYDAL